MADESTEILGKGGKIKPAVESWIKLNTSNITCDQPHRLSRTRSIPQLLIREIVNTSKGFNPHNSLKQ